jgi:hypothetical protein
MSRHQRPLSQTWRAFLENHLTDLVSIDFFTVPSATFQILFVFVVLAYDRRRVLHFNVTQHPTAEWTARQIVEAFPWDTAPQYLLRDRDGVYGTHFRSRVAGFQVTEVLIAPRAPWQNPLSFLKMDPPGDSTTCGTSIPTWRLAIAPDNGFRQPARPCPDFSSCSSLSLSGGFEWLFGRGPKLFSRTSP